jgi:hypothetical protein
VSPTCLPRVRAARQPSITSWVASAPNARPLTTVTPKSARLVDAMPISTNSGLLAPTFVVPSSAPVTRPTPGYAPICATWSSLMLLFSRSDTPFCATVKSARPVCSRANALERRLWLTTPSVTTASTPMATVSEVNVSRSLRTHRLCAISPRKLMPGPSCAARPGCGAVRRAPRRSS